jgi:hypothetical protein
MNEQTQFTPAEEVAFQAWGRANGLSDLNSPEAHYDYRGFWKMTRGLPHLPGSEQHFPDLFKQHGHPTFSVESRYSRGSNDGGTWRGTQQDQFVPQGADLLGTSRRGTDPQQLASALSLLIGPLLKGGQ